MIPIPENDEAVKITVTKIEGDSVTLQIRLRAGKEWLYLNKTVKQYEALIVQDGKEKHNGIDVTIPREAFPNGL